MISCDRHTIQARLTKAEEKVVECLFRGMSNVEIAAKLGVSVQAVRTRLLFAYRKLHVVNRAGLIFQAIREGAFHLWLYAGEPYVPPKAKKFETAAEKRAAEVRARKDAELARSKSLESSCIDSGPKARHG